MNEQLKDAVDALLAKIETAGAAGVNGTFIADLKDLAKEVKDNLEKE